MRTGAVLFFHLFHRVNSSAKVCELGEFLLNRLKPFQPLVVRELCLRVHSISTVTPIVVIQLLKLCDLSAETPNLFSKHFEVIHAIKNNASGPIERRFAIPSAVGH
jgi:hypothetical protein